MTKRQKDKNTKRQKDKKTKRQKDKKTKRQKYKKTKRQKDKKPSGTLSTTINLTHSDHKFIIFSFISRPAVYHKNIRAVEQGCVN